MIVQRVTTPVKVGCMEKIVKLCKAEFVKLNNPGRWRMYTPNIGPGDILAWELEFENFAEYEKFWVEWWSHPETPEFNAKWYELVEAGGNSEVWNLEK